MSSQKVVRPVEILLVEDNPADVRLTKEVLAEEKIVNTMHVAEDGEKALKMLRQEGDFASLARPDLIILDLNLPRRDGRSILKEIKGDEKLKSIPVVVLTTSNLEKDVLESYKNFVNCYIVKPVDLQQFVKVVRSIEDFWFSIVRLP